MMKVLRLVASTYPICAGLIFLLLSLLTFTHPEIFAHYSIGVDTPAARTAIPAMIGGGELAVAVLLLFGGRLDLTFRQRCVIAAVVFGCVGLARILSGMGEGFEFLIGQPLREASVELVLALLGLMSATVFAGDAEISSSNK